MFISIGDADGVRYEHALECFVPKVAEKWANSMDSLNHVWQFYLAQPTSE